MAWPNGGGAFGAVSRALVLLAVGVGVVEPSAAIALAEGATPVPTATCSERIVEDPGARTWTLASDCATEAPIELPNGWILDGGGHTIRAIEPAGETFRGGVIARSGGSATVRNVAIDGSALRDGCDPDRFVVGVWLDAAGGVVEGVTVTGMPIDPTVSCSFGVVAGPPSSSPVAVRWATVAEVGYGILVVGSEATIRGVTVRDAGDVGIRLVGEGGSATVSDATVEDTANVGISVEQGMRATIERTTVAQARAAIVAKGEGTAATISGNTIGRPSDSGISVEDGAVATVRGNHVADPGRFGIAVFGGAVAEPVADNAIDGGLAGIIVAGPGTRAEITDNTVRGPAQDGIYVQDGASAAVTGNDVTGGRRGIVATGQGTAVSVTGNPVKDASETGVWVRGGASSEVIDNVAAASADATVDTLFGPYGIRFSSGAEGRAVANSISGYLSGPPASHACAIAVDLDAGVVTVGEQTFPAPGNRSSLCEGTPPEGWNVPTAPEASPVRR